MTKYFALLIVAVLSCSAATIGLEDWANPHSDYDYNDIEIFATGLTLHTLNPWTFVPPDGYAETPFPGPASYFDYGVVSGPISATVISSQTTASITPLLSVNGGAWSPIIGLIQLATTPGDVIRFGIFQEGQGVTSSDPAQNRDGKSYGVVATDCPAGVPVPLTPEVPEPLTAGLIGAGLVVMWVLRRGNVPGS